MLHIYIKGILSGRQFAQKTYWIELEQIRPLLYVGRDYRYNFTTKLSPFVGFYIVYF